MSGFSQDSMRYITTAAGGGIEAPGSPQYFIAYRDNAAWGGGTYYAIDSSGNIETMFTAGGGIGGGGTLNYIPKYTPDGTHLGNSLLFDNGTSVLFGGTTAIASAGIAMTSTSQGFLAPRMTTAQRNAIAAPATGLLVYNTSTSLFCYWDGATWQNIDSQAGGDVSGSGTTNQVPLWTDGPNSVLGDSVISQSSGGVIITQTVNTTGSPTALSVVGGAHTTLTASTESIGANFNFSATKQFATGALTTQREVLFQAPTYAFVAASTITTAATIAISAAPIAGTNATITNSLAFWVQSGETRLVGSATSASTYALRIHNSSGTNNSLVVNNAGFVGIGIAATLEANLHIVQAAQAGTSAPTAFLLTGGAHTTLAAGFESIGARFNFAQTKQWATGAIAIQREIYIEAPTYAFVAASTITTAATFTISSAPTAGTNATITTPLALWVQSGESRFTGSGTTSATYAIRTYNSTPTEIFSVRNDSYISAGETTYDNITIGIGAGFVSNATTNANTVMGVDAAASISTGAQYNTAYGNRALFALTTGDNNTAVGQNALALMTTTGNNTAVGSEALSTATGSFNNAFGALSQQFADGGSENCSFGYQSIYLLSGGSYNVAFGNGTLASCVSGSANVAVGTNAGRNNNSDNNTFLGDWAGYSNTGTLGVYVGRHAGIYETAGSKLFIDVLDRTNEATGRVEAMIYGVFSAAILTQFITFNANTTINGSITLPYAAKTGTYTIVANDYTINCTANTFTVTLPTAVGITGKIYVIKNSGAGTITLDGDGTETIDGATTQVMAIQYASLTVQSNGANWIII